MKKYIVLSLLWLMSFGLVACKGANDSNHFFTLKTQGKSIYYGMEKSKIESLAKTEVEPKIAGIFQTDLFSGILRDDQLVLLMVDGENGFTTNFDIDAKDTKESIVETLGEPQEKNDRVYSYYYEMSSDAALTPISTEKIKDMHPDDRSSVYALGIEFSDDSTIRRISFGDYPAYKYAK